MGGRARVGLVPRPCPRARTRAAPTNVVNTRVRRAGQSRRGKRRRGQAEKKFQAAADDPSRAGQVRPGRIPSKHRECPAPSAPAPMDATHPRWMEPTRRRFCSPHRPRPPHRLSKPACPSHTPLLWPRFTLAPAWPPTRDIHTPPPPLPPHTAHRTPHNTHTMHARTHARTRTRTRAHARTHTRAQHRLPSTMPRPRATRTTRPSLPTTSGAGQRACTPTPRTRATRNQWASWRR